MPGGRLDPELAADPLAGLQHQHVRAGAREADRGAEAPHPRADHDRAHQPGSPARRRRSAGTANTPIAANEAIATPQPAKKSAWATVSPIQVQA